jgi:hypothetical protein
MAPTTRGLERAEAQRGSLTGQAQKGSFAMKRTLWTLGPAS